jgi:uncharacterized protein with PQ loop repeat
MGWSCGFDYPFGVACWLGNIASFAFFIVYVPNFILNFRRKSCKGFSLQSTAIKLLGSSFLFVNSIFNESPFPVFLYGFLNTGQHIAFLIQFWLYGGSTFPLSLSLLPLFPFLICIQVPNLVPLTDLVKPVCQIASHIPQLRQCLKLRSTAGVSLLGQHLNFAGCVFGCGMCALLNEQSVKTWLIYINSGVQAVTLYAVAVWYREMRLCDSPVGTRKSGDVEDDRPFVL